MKKLIVIMLILAVASCRKADISPGVPKPVHSKINDFAQKAPCTDAKVDEYLFSGEIVYVFDNDTCGADMVSPVLDSKGHSIGQLGGIAGNSRIQGENFNSAEFRRTVWKNGS